MSFNIIKKGTINYLLDNDGKIIKFNPWLGELFTFIYDTAMKKSVFPKLFNADIKNHFEILKKEFKDIHALNVIEIASGSGSFLSCLPNDNKYTGIDISKGLLKKTSKRLHKYGFKNYELYNTSAEILPFDVNTFDMAVCNLSLNFFNNTNLFLQEIGRVLKKGAFFFGSVPVPERNFRNSNIRGKLYSENELKELFLRNGFIFESRNYVNGAILYFSATL